MPLNPPSYRGQDVWFSPDVFVNKSEVALWQPPKDRDDVPDPSFRPFVEGDSINTEGTAEEAAQAAAYLQRMVQDGLLSPEDAAKAAAIFPNAADQSNNNNPSRQIPPRSTSTDGVENLRSFPPSLQLSRYFTLQQVTEAPWIQPSSHARPIPENGYSGLTKGQIVANIKLLALNIMDPVKDRYPDMFLTSVWRPDIGNPKSQHMLGEACDMQFSGTPKSRYFDIAVWMRDNLPVDQLLLEYTNRPTCWIHASFRLQGRAPGPYKIGTLLNHRFVNTSGLTNMSGRIGMA